MGSLSSMHAQRFLSMDEQGIAEALLSSCNYTKAIVLLSMKEGVPYMAKDLFNQIRRTVDMDTLPFSEKNPYSNCKSALSQIGMVVERRKLVEGKYYTAYEKNEIGARYGDPVAVRALVVAENLQIPLTNLIGATFTSGRYRRSYTMAKTIECLYTTQYAGLQDIASHIGISSSTIGNVMGALNKTGTIKYVSVNLDTYASFRSHYTKAVLSDRSKLERCLQDLEALKTDVATKSPKFLRYGHLKKVLELRLEELEVRDLALRLNIHKDDASRVISILCKNLGVYRYGGFNNDVHSSAELTDRGRYLYENLIMQVLDVAKNPKDEGAIARLGIDIDSSTLKHLMRMELSRYETTKHTYSGGEFLDRVRKAILLTTMEKPLFRPRDVIHKLDLKNYSYTAIVDAIKDLCSEGFIESAIFMGLREDGSIKTHKKGFYRKIYPIVALRR